MFNCFALIYKRNLVLSSTITVNPVSPPLLTPLTPLTHNYYKNIP